MTRTLVDTSVWIDHLRQANTRLASLLDSGLVVVHPMVIGELALGNLRDRDMILALLSQLPAAAIASNAEILQLIESRHLHGTGLNLVDTHLLASALIGPDVRIWTRDRRLTDAAAAASVEWNAR